MSHSVGRSIVPWVIVGVILVLLFAPVVLVVLFSFNGGGSTSPPLDGLSLHWYSEVFNREEFVQAMWNSAVAAVATAIFAVVAGTAAAMGLVRLRPRSANVVMGFVTAPLVVPGLFLGVALLTFFSRANLQLSLATVIVGHVLITLPLVVLVVSARLSRLDHAIVDAARDLGASGPQAFLRILLPMIAPALAGAALLAVAWSVDEFLITLFTNGGDQTVPVLIFGSLRRGLDPSVNAIASIVLATTLVATALAGRFLSVRDLAD